MTFSSEYCYVFDGRTVGGDDNNLMIPMIYDSYFIIMIIYHITAFGLRMLLCIVIWLMRFNNRFLLCTDLIAVSVLISAAAASSMQLKRENLRERGGVLIVIVSDFLASSVLLKSVELISMLKAGENRCCCSSK